MSFMNWFDERAGLKEYWDRKKSVMIPDHLTFFRCFGGISLSIIILQLLTGSFMTFYYSPKPEEAFDSIIYLSNEVTLGWLIRDMHRWGATILIATLITHMANVFYQKAFSKPRELNWMSGFTMLILVILFSVTGSILPWNWRSYWVFSIGLDYIGTWPVIGDSIKSLVVDNFSVGRSFVIHIFLLPVVSALVLAFHFKMVKKHGIKGPL